MLESSEFCTGGATPGASSANSRKFRLFSGTESICCCSITVPTSEVSGCDSGRQDRYFNSLLLPGDRKVEVGPRLRVHQDSNVGLRDLPEAGG